MEIRKTKKNKLLKRFALFLLFIFLMIGSFEAGLFISGKNKIVDSIITQETVYMGKLLGKYNGIKPGILIKDIDFDLFWDVWDAIEENYVDKEKLNEKKMFYGAIRGLVASLEDPYTVFMDPKIAQDFNNDLAGTFEGIGAEIGIKNDILTIIAPLPDMPAEKAGLKAGDKIYAIDGESTMGMNIDEAVSKIRGPKETNVILSVARDNQDGFSDISIERGKIIVKSVYTKLREDNIFIIEISNFNEDTENLFNNAVKEALKLDPAGIIIDLRNNPGGFLDTAIEVASEWVDDGVIVTEKYTEEKKIEHLARGRARLAGYKTVVLVNQGSASASEIVSGALKDYGQAVIVGKKTFGKGSVQTLSNLSDGSSIKITVAKWLTPNGLSINDEGITPDVEVDLTIEDYSANQDPQLEKA
ncbi:MAG: S41 family peptidase, partial [Patescibacteria group bacterium]|nr:S41 family peptidase [Patescibacteria group bacterium]